VIEALPEIVEAGRGHAEPRSSGLSSKYEETGPAECFRIYLINPKTKVKFAN